MKKIIIILAFMGFAFSAFPQQTFKLSLNTMGATSYNYKFIHGNIGFDWGVCKWMDLHYSLGMGVKGNGKFCMRMPYTIPVGLIAVSYGYGALLLLLPQGLSFNVPVNEKIDLCPFINFNTAELYFNEYSNDKYLYVGDLGLKLRYKLGKMGFAQASTAMKIEGTGDFGILGEVGVGLSF